VTKQTHILRHTVNVDTFGRWMYSTWNI